jgi:ribosomal protein S18 acetylase RimI-like enzyme
MLSASVRTATPADVKALTALINRAYAIEAFFVDGDRTSQREVEELIGTGRFVVLEDDRRLAAAVNVDPQGYFGMLAVEPELQGRGLGRRLVAIAEAMCEASGAAAVRLRIINLREELSRWYRSLGYRETGTSPCIRPAKRPCHFVEMRKELS